MESLPLSKVDDLFADANLKRLGPYVRANLPIECECLTCGKLVAPRFASVQSGHQGCKYCAAKARAAKRKTSDEEAERTMKVAGVEPLEPYVNISHPWKSKCLRCGEVVTPQYQNVKRGHAACKYCAGKALTTEKAIAIYLASGAKPISDFAGTQTSWKGVCMNCGGEVAPRLGDLVRGQGPCLRCGINKTREAQRLTEQEATTRMMEAGAEPLEPWGDKTVDSAWLCRCMQCDSTIAPSIHSITSGQGPCVHCGRAASAEKRTLNGEEQAAILAEHGFIALEPYQGMGKPWDTQCMKCGTKKRRRLSLIKLGHGCIVCAHQAAKIPESVAAQEMDKRGWKPLEPYVSANLPWKCSCKKCGHIQFPRLYSLSTLRPSGCLNCGERTLGSIFYLVYHKEQRAYKVGVGKERRIDDHLWNGWTLVERWDMGSPADAYSLEKTVLLFIREQLQLPQHLGKQDMPQKGATETFSLDESSHDDWIHLVNKLM